jgi:hypothetical protein
MHARVERMVASESEMGLPYARLQQLCGRPRATVAGRRRPGLPPAPVTRHPRPRGDDVKQATTTIELFFDLVSVFAITQLSHLVLDDPTVAGIVAVGDAPLIAEPDARSTASGWPRCSAGPRWTSSARRWSACA